MAENSCHLTIGDQKFECINTPEAQFLYDEIFTNSGYLLFGVTLNRGDLVFDVGANIGLFTAYCGIKTNKDVTVYAFEPISELFTCTSKNAQVYNDPTKTHLIPAGISTKENDHTTTDFVFYSEYTLLSSTAHNEVTTSEIDTIKMMLDQTSEKLGTNINSESIISTSFRKAQRTAKLRSLSSLIKEHSVPKIDLLKVDVEKAEWDVLMGIEDEDWPKIQQVVVEVHDIDGRVNAVHKLLQDKHFTRIERQACTPPRFLVYRELQQNEVVVDEAKKGLLTTFYATRK